MGENSFYSLKELEELGLKAVGDNVLLSKKVSIYGAKYISIGNHVRIDDFCILSGHIEIGNYIHIAAYSAIYGGEDGVFIDDFANLSSRTTVYSVSDDYSGETMTNPMISDTYKNVTSAPVKIGKHVIIGSTSVVLPGVALKEGSAFGAFSFINRDSREWTLNAGIPFKTLRERKKNILELEKEMKNQKGWSQE